MSAGAAGDRVAELLDRWLAGVELHARYLELDDAAYARVQDWPRHQRPTRWIVELARSRCVELKRQLAERSARGDQSFADALELMAFLTNLLGSEHVERFIPLPDARGARRPPPAGPTPAAEAPAPAPATTAGTAGAAAPAKAPATQAPPARPAREPRASEPRTAHRTKSGTGARSTPKAAPAARPGRTSQAPSPRKPASAPHARPGVPDARSATVIADAVRMLNWGRPWPQLASLIARLADRPGEAEVWEILRRHRVEIEAQARPSAD